MSNRKQLRINFQIILFAIFNVRVISVGCPFWQNAVSGTDLQIQQMALLKSNPMNQQEDIAVIIYTPFQLRIFNIQTNQQYQQEQIKEDTIFYQVDKDDRITLKISLLHTLDGKGRIIDWNPMNGLKQKIMQIPMDISINKESCLNSQESLVFTWNSTHIFVIDFSKQLDQNGSILIQKLNIQRNLIKCINDKQNRRFLVVDSQGGINSYDILSNNFQSLFQINQFASLLSIYLTQNQIAVLYQTQNNLNFVISYQSQQIQFQQQINQVPRSVLVNQQEDQLIVIGDSNLFQVWQIKQNKIIYEPNFQSLSCDFQDSQYNIVDKVIDFKFGYISQLNEVVIVSNQYFFAYSLETQKPIVFKTISLIKNIFIQAYIIENQIILASQQTISVFDQIKMKITYITNYLQYGATNYDYYQQIQVDPELNRIILLNHSGQIQYWSYFDNILESNIIFITQPSFFILDKKLNKIAQYVTSASLEQENAVAIINYRTGHLIEFLKIPFNNTMHQDFQFVQDKTNGFLLGIGLVTTQYMIFRFQNDSNHTLIFNGTFVQTQPNLSIQTVYLIEQSQQILIQIQNQVFLFSYFYQNAQLNNPIPIQSLQNPFLYLHFNNVTLSLFVLHQQYIQIFSYTTNQFQLAKQINFQAIQNALMIQLVEEQQVLIQFINDQINFYNYLLDKTMIFNLQNQPILNYICDNSKSILIAINNQYTLYVINISNAGLLYYLKIDSNLIYKLYIYTDLNIVIVTYKNGNSFIFNYINYIVKGILNYLISLVQIIDSQYNNLFIMSNEKIFQKPLQSLGIIQQIQINHIINYYFEMQSGLIFILADKVYIYNSLTQLYLSPFPSIDISDANYIFGIPSQNLLFIQFGTLTSNKISVYQLNTYQYIGDLSLQFQDCQQLNFLVYDQYLNRLFASCSPQNSLVWDLNNNFKFIKLIKCGLPVQISFDIKTNKALLMLYTWFSYQIDYQSLSIGLVVTGIYGDFDHFRGFQFTWDQNGDIRVYDSQSSPLIFQHAHSGWVNQVIIDSTRMIITSIGYQNTLQAKLNVECLDFNNNYLFIGDNNGNIYQLTYPNLILKNTLQVCKQQIDTLYLDLNHNILIYGSQQAGLFGFYNLLDFIVPYGNSQSYKKSGVQSVLKIDNETVIFHQNQNFVQKWNFNTQKLEYGFFIYNTNTDFYNSQGNIVEPQSKFLLLKGQNQRACLIVEQQLIFFDTKSFSILSNKRYYCLRNTLLFSYLICSFQNELTIFNTDDYSTFQQFILNENQSIIKLQSIDEIRSFIVTTTQGEVILYSLNQIVNQFQQQIYTKLNGQAISNFLFVAQSDQFLIYVSFFDGQFAIIQISKQLIITEQKFIQFQGINSQVHIISQFTDKIFVKRVNDLYLGIYSIGQFNLISQISSPCIGYTFKLDVQSDFDIILQHCVGVYQVNSFKNYKQLAYGRFTNSLNFPELYTPDQNQIVFINKNYFIDAYDYKIFIYQIDYAKAQVIMLGNFSYLGYILGKISNYFVIDTPQNTYIQLLLYSATQLGRIQLPIQGEKICQENIPQELFTQTLFQIQLLFDYLKSYYLIERLLFKLAISSQTIIQPLPKASFSQITSIQINYETVSSAETQFQVVYVSENIFQSFNQYYQIILENLQLQPLETKNDIQIYNVKNIMSFQLNNVKLASQILYSFQISQVQSVQFNKLYLQNITLESNQILNLFNFTQVNNMSFDQINVKKSQFSQVILFNFQEDINSNTTSQISFTNFLFENSNITFKQNDQQQLAPIFIQNSNQVTFNKFTLSGSRGSSIPFVKSFTIQNYQFMNILFSNNQDMMLFQYSNSIDHYHQQQVITQQILNDTIYLEKVEIQSSKQIQPSIFSIVSIKSSQLYFNSGSALLNIANFTNQNSIFSLQVQNISMKNISLQQNQGFQNLMVLQNSQLGTLQNFTISDNIIVSALLITQSNITLLGSQIKQNNSKPTKQQISVFTVAQKSQVNIINVIFESNQSNNGGSLIILQSQLFISQCSFKGDKSTISGGSIFSQESQLNISQSQFQKCFSPLGGCLFIQEGFLNIIQSSSQNTSASQLGGFVYISQVDSFNLEDVTIFSSFSSGDGGSAYISQSIGEKSLFKNVSFQNNLAKGSGGAILLDSSDFQIVDCKFINNKAGIGGAIRYLNLKPSFMKNQKSKIKDSCKTYQNNICQDNSAIIFGNTISSYPTSATILPSKNFNVLSEFPQFTFSDFQSGLTDFDLTINFFDEFSDPINQVDFQDKAITDQLSQQLIQEISQYSCKAYLQNINSQLQYQNIKLDGATLVGYSYRSDKQIGCFMNNLKITGVPSSQATMQLQLSGMKAVNKTNQYNDIDNIEVKIEFRSCKTGEFYNQICQNCLLQECVQCQNGTYSLVYPTKDKKIECKNCDMNQVYSCYSDQILLREDYWRIDNRSDLIYKCDLINHSCNGNQQRGYCSEGFTGALCSTCDIKGKVWKESYQLDNTIFKNGIKSTVIYAQ
ncbi:transmembrane protein, putative (macronuclear) [Tetrahymena thermophila SB210]|uniref:Transmembrane protein, putative n=1 Tax=Tetrahymena thermophila (strain SB210) TaxID=312017 RepID=W7XAE2_TETTS|nr:transmembrane protein, putative [Tetrahymena thermophila SB210]EWS76360.1 transmembrane protein, putative [Tetrahymena thermophila SB210]|eukprot:XP_012651144.1 transmembrane protein, putative [Tetrahymena thermophila SB210]